MTLTRLELIQAMQKYRMTLKVTGVEETRHIYRIADSLQLIVIYRQHNNGIEYIYDWYTVESVVKKSNMLRSFINSNFKK